MKMSYRLGILVSFLLVVQSWALPRSMAALGDSITAAAIANINRDDGSNNLLLPKFFWTLIKFGYSKSISAFEDRKLSWATGWSPRVQSHSQRIDTLLKNEGLDPLQAYNAAVSGDTSFGLALQVENVLNWSASTLTTAAPDYVVLEIGANDLCTKTIDEMTPSETYLGNVEVALSALLEKNIETKILVGSNPNLETLRNVAMGSAVKGLPFIKTCQDMWNTHGFCKDFLQEQDPAKREIVTQRLLSYKEGLSTLVQKLNTKYGEDKVRFSDAITEYQFSDTEISVDCFHPNVEGQQSISDIMWNKTWWAQ